MTLPQRIFPFKPIPDTERSIVASFAGLPLVVETTRALKVRDAVKQMLHSEKRESGICSEGASVESFVTLLVAGG